MTVAAAATDPRSDECAGLLFALVPIVAIA
jgi:hypothetical protein